MGSLTDSVAKTWRKDMAIYAHKVFREMETQQTRIETNKKNFQIKKVIFKGVCLSKGLYSKKVHVFP